MYKKHRIIHPGPVGSSVSVIRPFCDDDRIARPFSYYLQGGVNLSGSDKRQGLPDVFDDSETVASGDVDILTDPRVSRFDVVDFASEYVSEREARAAREAENLPRS